MKNGEIEWGNDNVGMCFGMIPGRWNHQTHQRFETAVAALKIMLSVKIGLLGLGYFRSICIEKNSWLEPVAPKFTLIFN
jgi:hypothetical protein